MNDAEFSPLSTFTHSDSTDSLWQQPGSVTSVDDHDDDGDADGDDNDDVFALRDRL